MAAIRGVRARAREELTREIKREARRQLALTGAQQLSLRAVARELGMASSALYRYFPSRDDLLTALVVDAYTDLAEAVERAVAAAVPAADAGARSEQALGTRADQALGTRADQALGARPRWRAACLAVRRWGRANPHEYALIYGAPVPGFTAPARIAPVAARIPAALLGVLRTAGGRLEAGPGPGPGPGQSQAGPGRRPGPQYAAQLGRLAAQYAPELPPAAVARVLVAWTQLFGMVGFELFGQLAVAAQSDEEFFVHSVEQMADFLGLPQARESAA
ncbi:TetR/AcrR family transcriptional regulator [Kitasatospora sp. NPDC008050]|uniref:TetR/AcrR family transcriptional regulator n=1 Tax=Kitasatospora sp. NPDC008050 TaxID=3364021 RepID=UPI0036E01DF3